MSMNMVDSSSTRVVARRATRARLARLITIIALTSSAACSGGADGSGDQGGAGDTGGAGGSAANSSAVPTSAAAADRCGLVDPGHRTVEGEAERTYELWYPEDSMLSAESPAPLLILFHGHGSNAEAIAAYTHLEESAPAAGVVLATPQGLGEIPTWNVLTGFRPDEEFVNAIIDELTESPCIDADRVWLAGHSAGAAMSGVFGCFNADRIEGLGLNAGLPPPLCPQDESPAVIITHGTDDAIVPFEGGAQTVESTEIPLASIPESSAGWAERAGCGADPTVTEPTDGLEVRTWSGCARGDVILQIVEGGGHSWPGGEDLPEPRQDTGALDSSCVLLQHITDAPGDPYAACATEDS